MPVRQPVQPHPLTLTPRSETQISTIEAAFQEFTERKDVAILLINQHVRTAYIRTGASRCSRSARQLVQIAEKIRPTVDRYQQTFPTLLEIPSKDHPYGMSIARTGCPYVAYAFHSQHALNQTLRKTPS